MTERERLLIEKLNMKHLNLEAGLFGFVRESDLEVRSDNETLAASNLIYLMLNQDEPINYIQMLESDDTQVLIEGGPADYYLFYPDGRSEKFTMGRDIENGEQFAVPAPGGTAKAIVLQEGVDYMLAASLVTPAWTPTRVEIGGDHAFIERYADSSNWATIEKLHELIGPNFGHIAGGRSNELNLHLDEAGQIIFLGMQLSEGQAEKEIRRFAETCPGKSGNLTVSRGASQSLIATIEQAAHMSKVNMTIEHL